MDHDNTEKSTPSFVTHHPQSTLAQMQQALVIGALVASLSWFLWFWGRSGWLAVAGALVILLGYALVLAIEFVRSLVAGDPRGATCRLLAATVPLANPSRHPLSCSNWSIAGTCGGVCPWIRL
jgi:hypothetical protein